LYSRQADAEEDGDDHQCSKEDEERTQSGRLRERVDAVDGLYEVGRYYWSAALLGIAGDN